MTDLDLDALERELGRPQNRSWYEDMLVALIQRVREAEAAALTWKDKHRETRDQATTEARERDEYLGELRKAQARIAQLERVREAAEELVDEYDTKEGRGLLLPDLRAALAAVDDDR